MSSMDFHWPPGHHETGERSQQRENDNESANNTDVQTLAVNESDSAMLNDLGLEVLNQEDLEQSVLHQVDQAVTYQEKKRLLKFVKTEALSVCEKISLCSREIAKIEKRLKVLPSEFSGNELELHKLETTSQQQNKLQELEALTIRQDTLESILNTANIDNIDVSALEQVLGLASTVDSNNDELVCRGEVTPFGTSLQDNSNTVVQPTTSSTVTDFEKYLLDQNSKSIKNKKRKSINSGTSHSGKRSKMDTEQQFKNKFKKDREDAVMPSKGKQLLKSVEYPGYQNDMAYVTNGSESYDYEDVSDSGSEYRPDEEELKNSWSGSEHSDNSLPEEKGRLSPKVKERKRTRTRKTSTMSSVDDLEILSEEKSSVSRFKDDGNPNYFRKRIKMYRKKEAARKYSLASKGHQEFDDVIFDGCFKVPGVLWNKLYKYQRTGVRWLWELHDQQAGGIVGDEMGLGKTLQMITFLAGLRLSHLKDKGTGYSGLGPTLIICPATVMHQWVREFHKWWPPFKVVILHSSGSSMQSEKSLIYSTVQEDGILVTSYGTMLGYQDLILKYKWHYAILDEGHKIRNPDAKITVACKQVRTCHRIILSGSPVQNNLKELWSLIDFIFPGKLGTLPDFMEHFSVPIVQGGYANASQVQVQTAYKCASILRDTINPYLLRRTKADVQDTLKLPSKNEQVLFCRLTDNQTEVYKEYLASKECSDILSGRLMIFPGLIMLRKICNHPDLSTGGPKLFCHELNSTEEALQYGYYKRSGKMIVVEALLKLWKKQNHKVLLFTQTKQMLNLLEKFVLTQEYSYLRLDGSTPVSSRQRLINQFNSDASLFVFLLTTRVGGLGVNLTGANRIIIFDPDWNPSTDVQARERSWRIGQDRHVTIYRLLTAGTIEEKIYHRQIFKQFLTNRVLKDPKQRRFFKANDMYELFTLSSQVEETETNAIFAGTGSEVEVKRKSSKPNRFDVLKKEKPKSDSGVENKSDDEELVDSKVKAMKELAKQISKQFMKRASQNTDSQGDGGGKPSKMKSKRTKKKKRKDAVCEGERIAYLSKVSQFDNRQEKEDDELVQNQKQNDYVLAKLFKKSGVHSALQHDTIMQSSQPDFALVEAEAERVASSAAKALKKSRARCYSPMSGIPTWTGGSNTQAPSTRFGKKKRVAKTVSSVDKVTNAKERHFDGKNRDQTDAVPSSHQLISTMQTRTISVNDDDGPVMELNSADYEMISDIRAFIACRAAAERRATSAEVVKEFGEKLPALDSAKFKAMLKQICYFEKSNGVGVWHLKQEFKD